MRGEPDYYNCDPPEYACEFCGADDGNCDCCEECGRDNWDEACVCCDECERHPCQCDDEEVNE